MKKLALVAVLFAAPAFACPNMEEKADKPAETAQPITAQKDKKAEQPKKAEAPKAAEQPKKTDTAKAKDTGAKKPDKVSQR